MVHPTIPIESAKFLAIGGGMELSSQNPLIRKFVELSGGKSGKITVLPTASDYGHPLGKVAATSPDLFDSLDTTRILDSNLSADRGRISLWSDESDC